jgi:hypothetical protein
VNCKEALQAISKYLDENQDEDLRRTLQVHLKCCHHCQVIFDTTRKTIELYCDGKYYPLPDDVRTRLHAALREKCQAQSR